VKHSWSTLEKITQNSKQSIRIRSDIAFSRQIRVEETKNLVAEQQAIEVLRRNETGDVKGKIVEYAWWMKKEGYAEATIREDQNCSRYWRREEQTSTTPKA